MHDAKPFFLCLLEKIYFIYYINFCYNTQILDMGSNTKFLEKS